MFGPWRRRSNFWGNYYVLILSTEYIRFTYRTIVPRYLFAERRHSDVTRTVVIGQDKRVSQCDSKIRAWRHAAWRAGPVFHKSTPNTAKLTLIPVKGRVSIHEMFDLAVLRTFFIATYLFICSNQCCNRRF